VEREKNDTFIQLNKQIAQKDLKIKELQHKISKELQLFEESKHNFDDSVKKFSNFNPNTAEIMKIKKEAEKQNVENKRLSIELEN